MKKIIKPYMKKVLAYKILVKFLIAIVLSIIWNIFLNTKKHLTIIESFFFVMGMFFLASAWFNYLKLDGYKINLPKIKRKNEANSIFLPEERLELIDALEDEEEIMIKFIANIFVGLSLSIISVITTIL